MPTCSEFVYARASAQRSSDIRADFMAGSDSREVNLERRAKVLCAIDARSRSDGPLRRAHAIAWGVGAQMMLLHVVSKAPSTRAARHGEARGCFLLDSYARRLAREGQDTEVSIRSGRPYQTIADVANEWDADLIVLGPHRERFGDRFIGTSAERIAHRAGRPVLIVNQDPK